MQLLTVTITVLQKWLAASCHVSPAVFNEVNISYYCLILLLITLVVHSFLRAKCHHYCHLCVVHYHAILQTCT